MKLFVVLVLLLGICLAAPAAAVSIIEIDGGNDSVSGQMYLSCPISGQLGAFAFGTKSRTWSELYVGPTWTPNEHLSISFGAGREEGSNKTRWGSTSSASIGKASALYIWEDGGSGVWDRLEVDYQATDKLAVGVTNRTYTGTEKGLDGVLGYSIKASTQLKASFGSAGGEVSLVFLK